MRREFRKSYECVHSKAVERLERDWERMISYYAFPASVPSPNPENSAPLEAHLHTFDKTSLGAVV